ncbi:MAG: hypothetical protein DWQ07_06845 [Chloroflexi bacterium]|nr:MAG: hypothetical protein DWQ07_06845 [Chloroflexota bacterium]MBL1195582.1 hypothetical protein [Chloroflexota bacterium]NOH12867.1 hypothetical protein [Chloroflexota bacterium]
MLKTIRFRYYEIMSPTQRITVRRQAAHSGIALALGVVPWSKLGNLINESYILNPTTSLLLPTICALLGGLLWWYVLEQGTLKHIVERLQSL